MGKIILHAGTHKTGTTTIQNFLWKNRSVLEENGVLYPGYNIVGCKAHPGHFGMVNGFMGEHKSYSRDLAIRFFSEVNEMSKSYDCTILSAESIYRHYYGNPSNVSEYWEGREEFLADFMSYFESEGLHILLVFRDQVNYANSLYQEHVKATRYKKNFSSFMEEYWFHFDFYGQIKAFENCFPNVHVASFNELSAGSQLITKFFSLPVFEKFTDIFSLCDFNIPRRNDSIKSELVIFKRILNSSCLSKDELSSFIRFILNDKSVYEALSNLSFYSNGEHLLNFKSKFSEDNNLLEKRYSIRFGSDLESLLNKGFGGDGICEGSILLLMSKLVEFLQKDGPLTS